MTAIVLCPGPSLAKVSPPFSALTIGVNRAVLAHSCDWWVYKDWQLWRDYSGECLGDPSICTLREVLERFGLEGQAIESLICPVDKWSLFTAPVALVLAATIGAKRIDVYGADWTDEPDYDGVIAAGCRRDEDRWKQEREIWTGVVDWLKGGGITVNRITDGIC